MKPLTEMRVGLIIAIATALFGVFVGFQAWVANTLYTQNSQIGIVTSKVDDSNTTIHEVLTVLLNKSSISSSVSLNK